LLGFVLFFAAPRVHFHPSNFARRLSTVCKALGICHRRPKDLRDTYASHLLTLGVPLGWISRQLGHADASVMARHYARWIDAEGATWHPEVPAAGELPVDLLDLILGARRQASPRPHGPRRPLDQPSPSPTPTPCPSLRRRQMRSRSPVAQRIAERSGDVSRSERVALVCRRPPRLAGVAHLPNGGARPANVQIERYVPQKHLLPHCQLVVSHGGSDSVLGALAHGLPMVLLPIGADQPLNAVRCHALGVARVLDVMHTRCGRP